MTSPESDQTSSAMAAESVSCTNAKLVQFAHKWTINHFSYYLEDEDSEQPFLKSTPFSPATNDQMRFTLRLYPRSKDDNEEFVGVHIVLDSCNTEEATLQCKVSVLCQDGEKRETVENQYKFTKGKKRGWSKFVSRERLLDAENALLCNDKLTIYCEMGFITESSTLAGPKHNLHTQFAAAEQKLLSDMGTLYDSGKFSDFILNVNGTEYPVHKNILAARSSVFAELLDGAAENKSLTISDMEAEVFEKLMKYIYSGKIDCVDRFAAQLFVAACKYGLLRLKSICEESLCVNLSVASVVDVLVLSQVHESNLLKTSAIDFMLMNLAQVVESNHWKKLIDQHPLLYQEALSRLLPKLSRPLTLNLKKPKKAHIKATKRSHTVIGKIRKTT